MNPFLSGWDKLFELRTKQMVEEMLNEEMLRNEQIKEQDKRFHDFRIKGIIKNEFPGAEDITHLCKVQVLS